MPLLALLPWVLAGGLGTYFGFGMGDTASKIKTYTFYGVVVFALFWWFFKKK